MIAQGQQIGSLNGKAPLHPNYPLTIKGDSVLVVKLYYVGSVFHEMCLKEHNEFTLNFQLVSHFILCVGAVEDIYVIMATSIQVNEHEVRVCTQVGLRVCECVFAAEPLSGGSVHCFQHLSKILSFLSHASEDMVQLLREK